jgi:membrane protease subunit HflK
LAEYEKAPQVTRERIYLETMQQVMGATSKVLVDQKAGQNLLYLPLDRLMQMTTQGTVTVDAMRAAPETVTPAPVQEAPATRREGIRSRDREGGR